MQTWVWHNAMCNISILTCPQNEEYPTLESIQVVLCTLKYQPHWSTDLRVSNTMNVSSKLCGTGVIVHSENCWVTKLSRIVAVHGQCPVYLM